MRVLFVPVLIAAGFFVLSRAQAQSWEYDVEIHPETNEVVGEGVIALNREGGITVGCSMGLGMVVGVRFNDTAEELNALVESGGRGESSPSVDISWRVNDGEEAVEFATELFYGNGYSVVGPRVSELARMLVDARRLVTSNGGEGASERTLRFENLKGGEQIERVLEACGH